MAEKKPEVPTNPSKSLTDSDTSDDSDINPFTGFISLKIDENA